MIDKDGRLYVFGDFQFEPAERRLTRQGRPIALTPKAFDLLAYLVERAGHVVSKSELMESLWPGRIVLESNLTKHVWYLRRALGEDEDDARLIQTVSKLGYRFAAPVARDAAAGRTAAPAPVATDAPKITGRGRRVVFAGAGLVAAAVLGGLVIATLTREPAPAGSGAVAVVGLNNLSGNPVDAWVGPALTEMVATDIGLGGGAHALPDELVRPARADIALPAAGGFGRDNLATLRRRLDADYVVSGAYLVSGGPGAAILRIDFTVQNARSGATIATLSRSGAVSDLPALATLVGTELRRDLDRRGAPPALAAGVDPPTVDVMRHIGQGTDALQRYDAAHARDEFIEAVAEAPSYAPAYSGLARAWSALGYQGRALAAAEQALAHSADLPPLLRLQGAVELQETHFDWPAAATSLRRLIALRPRDPEYRLQLIDALLSAGKLADAGAALADLKTFGGRNDPRIELVAARIASAHDDRPGAVGHASRALAEARTRDSGGLAAEAEVRLGVAREESDPKAANALLRQALVDYRAVGNPRGEAWVWQNLGNLFSGRDPKQANAAYEASLADYQRIGDQNGVASAYSDLGNMLWASGDRDGAETAVRHVLDIRRQTQDVAGQAWALAALAVEQSDEAASDEAIANFRRAIALDEAAEARDHLGFALFSLSDDLRQRGALVQAAQTCAEGQKAFTGQADPANRAAADFECAQISLDIGDIAAAEAGLKRAGAEAAAQGDAMTLANAELTEGQIDMGLRNWTAAAAKIQAADTTYARGEMITGEAVSASLLAICDAALGRTRERDLAAARARNLRSRVTERQEVIQVDIALAQLRGAAGEPAVAIASLRDLAADAARRHWLGWSLEARLAAVQVATAAGDRQAGRQRANLVASARKSGFGWIVRRLG
ncbi:MAG: winged helix-turn-helix domain-containing protein [Caulobacteraceae bacterium]